MGKEFRQIEWDAHLDEDCRQIIRLGVREDLDRTFDLTTVALIPESLEGETWVVARRPGVVAGLPAAATVLDEMEIEAVWEPQLQDGDPLTAGSRLARLAGRARDLLTAERLLLNLLGRLSGIATLTRHYVAAVAGTAVRIYDTRKTTPGWRRLEKYAVRCGGGTNHRTGLFDAVLIKDNHLALGRPSYPGWTLARWIERTRERLWELKPPDAANVIIEIEVDSLSQLDEVLPAQPDIVLLDNMLPDQLREAVRRRNAAGVATELEASGGITLANIRQVAETGVERISIGALTHSATSLDLGLDWLEPATATAGRTGGPGASAPDRRD